MLAFALLLSLAQDRSSIVPSLDDEAAAAPAPAPARCGQKPDEITVCGNADPSRFRLRPVEERYREKPLRPQFALPGGGSGKVEAAQRNIAPGVSVPAAMLTLRIPLGGKKKAEAPEPQ